MRIFNSYLLKVAPTVNISKYTLPTKLALLILKTLAGQMPGNVSEHRGIGEHGWFVLAAEVLTVWVSQTWDVPPRTTEDTLCFSCWVIVRFV